MSAVYTPPGPPALTYVVRTPDGTEPDKFYPRTLDGYREATEHAMWFSVAGPAREIAVTGEPAFQRFEHGRMVRS